VLTCVKQFFTVELSINSKGQTMKSYQVELKCISYVSLEVEADSPEAAEAAAWLELQTGDYDDSATSWEVESVEATA
jgi:hypothetical protein